MTEFLDHGHLKHHGEHIKGCELVTEGRFVTHIKPMVEEDEQSYFGQTIDLKPTDVKTITRATIPPYNFSLWAYIDGTCNIARLPLHSREGGAKILGHILCTDQVSVKRQHELHMEQHSQDG